LPSLLPIRERYRRIPIPFQGRAGTTFVAR
jgi:hypothetical protein